MNSVGSGDIMSSVSGTGIVEGLVGTLGRWLGADRANSEPTSLTAGMKASKESPAENSNELKLYRLPEHEPSFDH